MVIFPEGNTAELADELQSARRNRRHLPGVELPPRVRVMHASELDFAGQDLVCFADEAMREAGLPAPALEGLAELIAGRLQPERWSATITAPPKIRAA